MKKQIFTLAFTLCAAFVYSQNTNWTITEPQIGIGTASPVTKFDVVKNIISGLPGTSTSHVASFVSNHSAVPSSNKIKLNIINGYNSSPSAVYFTKLQSTFNTTDKGFILFGRTAAGSAPTVSVGFGYGTSLQMRIQEDDKVAIGNVTTPGDYKLFVETGILTEKVKVAVKTTTDWADYVFAPDYQLMPLTEVEAFTKENGHLPNVPSADEMVTEGLDVAKMDAKLLEKVEELTLYLIEQQKQIDALKAELEAVKQQKTVTP